MEFIVPNDLYKNHLVQIFKRVKLICADTLYLR